MKFGMQDRPYRPLWLLFALGLPITSNRLACAQELTLKILTWNTGLIYIPFQEEELENAQPFIENRTKDEHLPGIARIIAREDPDFISLLEIRDLAQAAKIAKLLADQYSFIGFKGNRDRYAVLYFRKSFEVLEQDKIVSPGQREFPLVKIKTCNHEIGVVALHLSAFNIFQRDKQVDALLDWLVKREGTVILTGDFNFGPRHSNYQKVTAVARDLTDNLKTSTIAGRKLDYVFLRVEGFNVDYQAYLLPHRWGLMDHYPLVVHVQLTPANKKNPT